MPETENYGPEQEPCQVPLLNSGDKSLSPLISDEKSATIRATVRNNKKITMYQTTEAQSKSEAALRKRGFRFSAWLPFEPDAENQPMEGTEHLGIIVMVKRATRFSTEYREINPDGFIN